MNWKTRWRWDTGYSADSVEWCPVEPYRHVFVCGTYQLDKSDEGDQASKKQTRRGKIYLFTVDEGTTELSPIQTIDTAGILDQKWCYHTVANHPILAVATSIGTVGLYRLVDEEGMLKLKLWMEHSIGHDVLALSLDWSTNKTQSEEPKLVVSDSSGSVTIFRVAEDRLQENFHAQKSHGFEAWIAAFNYWNPDVFYSGGDDCLFKSYDVRVPGAPATYRTHDAGVTSVRKHLDVEHELLTGSYDEKVRRWDTRKLKACISETEVNGGVWRLKYHPRRGPVAAACMYGGFKLLETDLVVAEYYEHESIAYGADWTHDGRWLATCSFYDCKLHVSEVTFPT